MASSIPYGPGETFVILEVEEVRKQGQEVLIVPMHPRGLRLELMGLREIRGQAFEVLRRQLLLDCYREGARRSVPDAENPIRRGKIDER